MSQTVLMIDDCEILRNLAENIFKEHDYVVITSNSMECFEIFLEKHESIDLIIFDAGDLDISDEKVKIALEKFWEVKPGVKVIISGGYGIVNLEVLKKLSVTDHLAKPYKPNDMIQKVKNILDQK